MKLGFRLLIFCGFFLVKYIYAQQDFGISKHLTIDDGLPSNSIKCLFNDSQNNIWIGTDNGIAKFNGHQVQRFGFESGLSGKVIWDITETKDGTLWLSDYGNGVIEWKDTVLRTYTPETGLISPAIRHIYITKNDEVIFSGNKGISVLNNDKLHTIDLSNSECSNENNTKKAMKAFEYGNETYILTDYCGIQKLIKNNDNYSIEKQVHLDFTKYNIAFDDSIVLFSSSKYFIRMLADNNFKEFTILDSTSKLVVWDSFKRKNAYYLSSWNVHDNDCGLIYYDGKTEKNLNSFYQIRSNNLWTSVYHQNVDKAWIGTLDNGIYEIDFKSGYTEIDLPVGDNEQPYKIEQFRNHYYIQTPKSILIFNRAFQFIKKLDHQVFYDYLVADDLPVKNLKNKTEEHFEIFLSKTLSNGNVYIATNFGLYIFSHEQLKFINRHTNQFHHFAFSSNGEFLAQKPYANFVVAKNADSLEDMVGYSIEEKESPRDLVSSVQLKDFTLLASMYSGLYSYHTQKKCDNYKYLEVFKTDANIIDMANNVTNDTSYLASSGGRIIMATVKNDALHFEEIYQLPDTKGEAMKYVEYYNGHLLIGTNKGLLLFDPQTKNTRFLNEKEGLLKVWSDQAKVIGDSLFMLGETFIRGYSIEDLFKISENNPYQIRIASISVNGEEKKFNNQEFLKLDLNHNENTLEIKLNTICYQAPDKIRLSYRLSGQEKYIPIENQHLFLTGLREQYHEIQIKVEDLLTGEVKEWTLMGIHIHPPFYKQTWFIILIISIVLVISGGIIYFIIKKKQQKREKEMQVKQRINDTRMMALQAQMNPHFIFNIMNGIQNSILKEDMETALTHTGKLAKLIRKTLEFSGLQLITIEEELQYLKQYIELENLRFKTPVQVEYKIKEFNPEKTFIPPLLIQPLVENAFKHGFSGKEEAPQLVISFYKFEDGSLSIKVIDNGQQEPEKPLHHNSKGLKLIRERLELIHPDNFLHLQQLDVGTEVWLGVVVVENDAT